ncbi:MAG: hypothetical protein QM473_07525 [Acidobacteriota bacterium]|nr:hypothetical protein [Acidobacteriota bacterium]
MADDELTRKEPEAPEQEASGETDIPDGSVVAAQAPDVPPIEQEPEEQEEPIFDWLTELAIPLSIFGLLGCLLFYLIDLRQALGGEFSGGLRWICFFFLAAVIGITRIRTKYGTGLLALPYMLALSAVMVLAVMRFTMTEGALAGSLTPSGALFSILFNFSLVALIWWLADKVTRETTLEENIAYSLNQGLMSDWNGAEGRTKGARHPGRAVFWVSVAAIIAFGLGTRAIGDQGRMAGHAFYTMAGYVFFALLLLALTNLSAIRMDVRRRKVRMAWSLAPTWIIMSVVLVLLVVVVSAFLPRPRMDTQRGITFANRPGWLHDPSEGISGWTPGSGFSQPPSGQTAPGRDPDTTGEGAPTQAGADQTQGSSGQQPTDGSTSDQGQAGTEGGAGQSQSQGASGSGQGQSSAAGQSGGQGDSGAGGQGGEGSEGQAESSQRGQERKFAWWLLLLLLLLLALLIYLLIRYRRQVMAFLRALATPFQAMWLAFLAFLERLKRMLGLGGRRGDDEWADLPSDPFADIWEQRELGANMTPAQIVRHVYRAFLAFCSLRGHPRPGHQTEFEFLRTVPPRIGFEPDDQKDITAMYVFATYSPNEVGMSLVDKAKAIWSRLRPAIDHALAAQGGPPGK